MFKKVKVYICDACGKLAYPSLYQEDYPSRLPNGWIKFCKFDICPNCAMRAEYYEHQKEKQS